MQKCPAQLGNTMGMRTVSSHTSPHRYPSNGSTQSSLALIRHTFDNTECRYGLERSSYHETHCRTLAQSTLFSRAELGYTMSARRTIVPSQQTARPIVTKHLPGRLPVENRSSPLQACFGYTSTDPLQASWQPAFSSALKDYRLTAASEECCLTLALGECYLISASHAPRLQSEIPNAAANLVVHSGSTHCSG
jgi:hypothetical protein